MADSDPNSHLVSVQAPGAMADRIVAALKQFDRDQRPRQVMIDARIVAMESTDLMDLGVEWEFPQVRAGFFTDSYTFGDKAGNLLDTATPWGFSVGYSSDRSFTNSLLMYLNLLQQRGKADIVSNPQMLALDGKPARFQNTMDDYIVLTGPASASYYVQSEFETITSGTILKVTPRIGDSGDIILDLEVEVSETAPESQATGMPRVNRRVSTGTAMVQDGGTVALAGLTETRSETLHQSVPGLSKLPLLGRLFRNESTDSSTKEIAVFITAYLVKDEAQASTAPATTYDQRASQMTSQNFNDELARSLANY
jgi:general secretion pathway protein D